MRFNDLDQQMRLYETAHDLHVVPGVHIVIRLDGRSFTRLTKETHTFDLPFDIRVRDMMIDTAQHVMTSGIRAIYGYTQSDEISILLQKDDGSFDRKVRKLLSVLAGEASAKFSLLLGSVACFDARVCELPNPGTVVDYFRWRQEDAGRNALNAHCYWLLRKQGFGATDATSRMLGLSVSDKHEFLFSNGVNFTELPAWQRRGVGIVWSEMEKTGTDPRTGQQVVTKRRRLAADANLPHRDEYAAFIARIVAEGSAVPSRR